MLGWPLGPQKGGDHEKLTVGGTRRDFVVGAGAVLAAAAVPVAAVAEAVADPWLGAPLIETPQVIVNGFPVYICDRLLRGCDIEKGETYDLLPRFDDGKLIGWNIESATEENFAKIGIGPIRFG
jgi:hypothetical protein